MRRLCSLTLLLLIAAVPAAAQYLIPVAGNISGANGTFFKSDITIFNDRGSPQNVAIHWLPQGASESGTAPIITINAFAGVISEDFVGQILHRDGLGAILLNPVKADGTFDPNSALVVTSRVWTPEPGTTGTTSQSLPVVQPNSIFNTNTFIFGQRIDSRYRTNVGIVNLDPNNEQRFDVVQNTDDPTFAPVTTSFVLPPLSMQQLKLPDMKSTALQIRVFPRVPTDPRNWVAYGSTVDNVTGDAWSSLAFNITVP